MDYDKLRELDRAVLGRIPYLNKKNIDTAIRNQYGTGGKTGKYDAFKEGIYAVESKGTKEPYKAVPYKRYKKGDKMSNGKKAKGGEFVMEKGKKVLASTAAGKYQFIWEQHKDKIMKQTGITSKAEFMSSPEKQEKFMDWWVENALKPEAQQLRKLYPAKTKDFSDEKLMALVHFQGLPNAKEFLKSGTTANIADNLSGLDYMDKFEVGFKSAGGGVGGKDDTPRDKDGNEIKLSIDPYEHKVSGIKKDSVRVYDTKAKREVIFNIIEDDKSKGRTYEIVGDLPEGMTQDNLNKLGDSFTSGVTWVEEKHPTDGSTYYRQTSGARYTVYEKPIQFDLHPKDKEHITNAKKELDDQTIAIRDRNKGYNEISNSFTSADGAYNKDILDLQRKQKKEELKTSHNNQTTAEHKLLEKKIKTIQAERLQNKVDTKEQIRKLRGDIIQKAWKKNDEELEKLYSQEGDLSDADIKKGENLKRKDGYFHHKFEDLKGGGSLSRKSKYGMTREKYDAMSRDKGEAKYKNESGDRTDENLLNVGEGLDILKNEENEVTSLFSTNAKETLNKLEEGVENQAGGGGTKKKLQQRQIDIEEGKIKTTTNAQIAKDKKNGTTATTYVSGGTKPAYTKTVAPDGTSQIVPVAKTNSGTPGQHSTATGKSYTRTGNPAADYATEMGQSGTKAEVKAWMTKTNYEDAQPDSTGTGGTGVKKAVDIDDTKTNFKQDLENSILKGMGKQFSEKGEWEKVTDAEIYGEKPSGKEAVKDWVKNNALDMVKIGIGTKGAFQNLPEWAIPSEYREYVADLRQLAKQPLSNDEETQQRQNLSNEYKTVLNQVKGSGMSQGQMLGVLPQLMGKKTDAELNLVVKKEQMRRQNMAALGSVEANLVNLDKGIFAQRRADAQQSKVFAGDVLASGMQGIVDRQLYDQYYGPGSEAFAMKKLLTGKLRQETDQLSETRANAAAGFQKQSEWLTKSQEKLSSVGKMTQEQAKEIMTEEDYKELNWED